MRFVSPRTLAFAALIAVAAIVFGHPFPPLWQNGSGQAVHYQPVQWPGEPASPGQCGDQCGDWKPYTRFGHSIADPRTQDPSNGGTAPQSYVNVASSCSDKQRPSIYYYLHQGATAADDVIMFRWRVEQGAHNYATGPSAGNYSASNPWNSALWTVLFDVDGSGYRTLAAHLNGSSGSPAEPIDMLAGIWSNTQTQSIDYSNPNIHLLGHNPTALIGPTGKILNFRSSLSPTETWPNSANETVWDYGTTRAMLVSSSPCSEYFIDYQIPVGMLDATGVGGPKITRDTPIAMLFCTANSLTNPFQKDCAINRQWNADAASPAPFGDYLSFNKTDPYQQPIVASVAAIAPASCPGSYTLTTKVQDALALQNGVVVPSVKSVQFYYWYDVNADGEATAADTGSQWTRISTPATLAAQSLNTWTVSWNATALPKGKYLIGVQALDDATIVDDGMTSTGVDNRTFSYLSGDVDNKIYIAGGWMTGQQAAFPGHSPVQMPTSSENWFGNPSVTGNQVALIGTAINACGVAPTITLDATPTSVAAAATVAFTITVSNPASNASAITLSLIQNLMPAGFSYVTSSTSGANGAPSSDPTTNGQQLTWTVTPTASLAPGDSASLSFSAIAGSTAGVYSDTATASTSFGALTSAPAQITVDSARLSLSMTPSAYSIAADGTTALTYMLSYSNISGVPVTAATLSDVLPAGVTYSSCAGGSACSNSAGTVSWTLGTLAADSAGTATLTITVPSNYSAFSVVNGATLSATAPDASIVSKSASTTVSVTGVSLPGTPAFSLTKTAGNAAIAPGGSVTYTLNYANYGTGSASSVVLTDTLPAGMSYVSCSDSCSQAGGVVTWNIGTVAAGGSGSRTVTVTAANPFTSSNPAPNNASIAWSGGTPVTAQVSVGVTGQACSTYYFQNATTSVGTDGTRSIAGLTPIPSASDTGATVTATAPVSGSAFLEVLRFYQDPQTSNDVPFDGNITTNMYIDRANGQGLNIRATVYDYQSSNGAKTQLAQSTTLFNGSTKGLLSFTVTPSGTLQKGHRLLWVYEARSNHASQTVQVQFQYAGTVTNGISGGTTFANSNATYCVTPPANLTVSNLVGSASITEATTPTLTYTINYSNTGGASATNTSLIAALPAGSTGCQYSSDNTTWFTCSSSGASPPFHTFPIGTVAGGASGAVYVRGSAPSGTTAGNSLTGVATISSDQTTAATANATTAIAAAGGGGSAQLTLNLAANRVAAEPGADVVYTLTAINTGSANANNVVVSDTVPAAPYYAYSSCTGGCGVAGGTLTWPTIGSLAAGASQSYTYTMHVGTSGLPSGITTIADDAAVSGGGGLAATSNTVTVTLNGNPVLNLLNAAAPSSGLSPGDIVTYTIAVANSGAANASAVTVTNPVPANMTYAGNLTASAGSGVFDAGANVVRFEVGTLASGASVVLTFDAAVNAPLPSGSTMLSSTATVAAGNAAQQAMTANASASAAPILDVTQTAPFSLPYPAAVLVAAVSGQQLFVDRTDRLQVNQLIKIGSQVARVMALGATSIAVDTPISALSGTAIQSAMTISIGYRNTGNAIAVGTALHESLAAGFTYYSASPAPTSSPNAGNTGDVDWSIGSLAPGAGSNLQVIVFSTGTTGNFSNTATLSASGATDATATTVTTVGGLSVLKTTSTPVLSAGGDASYTIVVTNSLGTNVSPISVSDTLPEGFAYKAGSATVRGVASEPTFAVEDTTYSEPVWNGLTVAAGDSLTISFQTQVVGSAGAFAYQNQVAVTAPGGIGVMSFDPLTTTSEDVTILAAATGVLKGYVYRRDSGGNALAFNAATDTPLAGVEVDLHKAGADCVNPVGGNCYVVHTDANGYFERALPAEDWIVSVIDGSGELGSGWRQISGTDHNLVSVPDQGSILDYNGYSSIPANSYLVSTSAGANGSISPSSRTVVDGATTTFAIAPDAGFSVASAGGCGGALAGTTFTTAPITGNCTVSATFVSISTPTHTVAATSGAGGTIAPGSVSVADGNTTTFTVTPSAGFSISSVAGCGGSLSGTTFTTGAVTADCNVTAAFVSNAVAQHLVSTSAGAGGSIDPTSALVADGSTTAFTITASTGYSIASVTGCAGSLAGATYTTGPITSACTVSAGFSVSLHTVSTSSGTGGTLSPGSANVPHGSTTAFTVVPSSGFNIASVSGCGGALAGTTYTTGAITGACTVTATFINASIPAYLVSTVATSGGAISPSTVTVAAGSTTILTLSPITGYHVASASGCGGSLVGNVYATGIINAACTVSATFVADDHTVTTSAGVGGTITPPTALVSHGASASLSITPDSAHDIFSVTGCGGMLSGTTYTTSPIVSDCEVAASFVLKSHRIDATAGGGGSISPASLTISHGDTTSFTITAAPGYSIANVAGCGGSLSGSTYTTAAVTAACSVTATFSVSGPRFGTAPPTSINARALFTDVPLDIAPTATSELGLPLTVTLAGESKLRPGRHTLTWRAQDAQGRAITTQQQLDIWPTISLSDDFDIAFGSSASFRGTLNGEAPVYPHSVAFLVGGDGGYGTRHTLAPGVLTFTSGTEAIVSFSTLPQATSLPTQQLVVTLDSSANVGARGTLKIGLISQNAAPLVTVTVMQEQRSGTLVARNAGNITLHAAINDPNPLDTHTLQWAFPTGAITMGATNTTDLIVDAASLKAGIDTFSVQVTDSGLPALSSRAIVSLAVIDAAPLLGPGDTNGNGTADVDEGWSDSGNGIPAYLNRLTDRNVLPEDAPVIDQYLVEGSPGVRLRLGAWAEYQGSGVRLLNSTVAAIAARDQVENVGGYFNFDAVALTKPSMSVSAVIPQRQPIPEAAIYRLWDNQNLRWTTFIENAQNVLASSPGEAGYCPPPGDSTYKAGLHAGDWCMQVTIQDGGANDADHEINAAISKFGGVGARQTTVVTGTSSGRGGGGAMNAWLLTALAVLGLLRRHRSKLLVVLGSVTAASLAHATEPSSQAEQDSWYAGAQALWVHNAVNAATMDARLARLGYQTQTSLTGQSRLGGSLYGGYRWTHFGLEGGYADLGRLRSRVSGNTPIATEYLDAISDAHPRSGSGWQFNAVGYWPLTDRIELIGKLGAFYWRGRKTAESSSDYTTLPARDLDPCVSLGASYRLSTKWAVTVQWSGFRLDGENLNVIGAGLLYGKR